MMVIHFRKIICNFDPFSGFFYLKLPDEKYIIFLSVK